MDRPDLEGLPLELAPPPGYRRVPYAEPLLPAWLELLAHAFAGGEAFEPGNWRRRIVDQPQFRPEWVVLIERESDHALCATAFAWVDAPGETEIGRVHWVAAREEARGLGLGRLVTLLVLRELADAGFARAMLETQAYRSPAIQLYLTLGFAPSPLTEDDERLWRKALDALPRATG
jgi:GNAT superfamily N-acetyltransferase